MFCRTWPFQALVRDGIPPTWLELITSAEVECTNDRAASAWLNDENVRQAIHAAMVHSTLRFELINKQMPFF
uniref:Uncharacterized protein n=1 Tax=Cannabis sativa TaxID=3483 RepID=A0A803PTE7_CANSA